MIELHKLSPLCDGHVVFTDFRLPLYIYVAPALNTVFLLRFNLVQMVFTYVIGKKKKKGVKDQTKDQKQYVFFFSQNIWKRMTRRRTHSPAG